MPSNGLEALLDRWSRACLPYLTPQTTAVLALLVWAAFVLFKFRRDQAFPSLEDCLRVALTTVTLLTGLIAVMGLLLPTPPAPPEMNDGVLRAMGLTSSVSLFSYTGKILHEVFTKKQSPETLPPSPS
ncbi:MAG TPA: hypothetical protein VFR31_04730 [Thermoanaerobaculia bacterium]|nr:hypothetical protein [Thermoanaerobaculia bacterium]